MIFQEHGDYKVTADGEIILFIAKGSWNIESATRCIALINSCIEKIASNKFAMAVHTREITGNTPESYEALMAAINHWRNLGLGAVSFIDNTQTANYRVFVASFEKIFRASLNFKGTDTLDEAIKWFNDLGYPGFPSYSKNNPFSG